MKKSALHFLIVAALTLTMGVKAQEKSDSQDSSSMQNMTGMDHSHANPTQMGADEMGHTMNSMSGKHMDMGPHMKMTALRTANAGDQKKADEVVEQLRGAIEKYKDFKVVLADGFQIFQPNVAMPMKHFTNYGYAMEAVYKFNPLHPTSLLYEKHGDDYTLVGAMYTAPKRFTEDDLNQRIPLSVAQWHEHVNLCVPPKGQERLMFQKNPRFGLAGSISTQEACDAAGGKFYPIIFNWMVHVYPYKKTREEMWAVDRGHQHSD